MAGHGITKTDELLLWLGMRKIFNEVKVTNTLAVFSVIVEYLEGSRKEKIDI